MVCWADESREASGWQHCGSSLQKNSGSVVQSLHSSTCSRYYWGSIKCQHGFLWPSGHMFSQLLHWAPNTACWSGLVQLPASCEILTTGYLPVLLTALPSVPRTGHGTQKVLNTTWMNGVWALNILSRRAFNEISPSIPYPLNFFWLTHPKIR